MRSKWKWLIPCWLFWVILPGCQDAAAPAVEPLPNRASSTFDAAAAGAIEGRVTWEGKQPTVPPFQVHAHFLAANKTPQPMIRPNPHAPHVETASGGVANAIVFLRGVDAQRARSWSHPPVRIEQGDYQLDVVQGSKRGLVGFVRQGGVVEMVATKHIFHSLRVRGATFFTLAFVEPNKISQRPLEKKGLIELSSGAGYYWMRGYLFVDDHPYYARTDATGRFTLEQVPPGQYQLVCWLPNWHILKKARDPETSLVTRVAFAEPVEVQQTVTVRRGEVGTVTFRVGEDQFAAK